MIFLWWLSAFGDLESNSRIKAKDVTLLALLQTIAEFQDIVLVHEPNSQGIFFVNIKLLRLPSGPDSYSDLLSGRADYAWTSFILLSQQPTLLESMPPHLTSLLMQLCSLKDSSSPLPPSVTLSLSQPLQITETVPFAGFILEYPVAYVPTSADQTSFLAGVPLDVYECVLLDPDCTGEEEHTMLKFSCPCTVGAAQESLSPSRLPEILQSHFEPRLKYAGFLGSLVVRHHTETLARVAL
ncbi:hypothetical protein A0H81_08448 [Grifola frondosa]|uniref:Uncharacterized protein n=1 Tax=Grifola frondosa TaxID=5627 RepID=A0A1C7M4D2_GRIFR|nr:hypothetical protein A0H81_08448 [Grifola frondosa]